MFINPYKEEIHQHTDLIWNPVDFDKKSDWNESFPRIQPLVVDLGCGAGNFLRDLSLRDPHFNYVGFELRFKRLVKGAIKFKKRNLGNIRLVQDRAESLKEWFAPHSLSRIYVNFPDPWTKKRHRKHRMLRDEFFSQIHPLLTKKGSFHFKTDHSEYFQTVNEIMRQREDFSILESSEDLHQSSYADNNIITEFEELFKKKGLPIYYLLAQRN